MHIEGPAEHLLALFAFASVLADHWLFALPKRDGKGDPRMRIYGCIIGWQWMMAIAAIGIAGWGVFRTPPGTSEDLGWAPFKWLTLGWALVFVAGILRHDFLAARDSKEAGKLARGLGRMNSFLPHTHRERMGWAFLAITSGICEEVVFRGYMLHYLGGVWHLAIGYVIGISCLVFGLGHLYQGISQALRALLSGAMFFLIFLATGNLLLSIAIHVLCDLNVLVSLRIASSGAARSEAARIPKVTTSSPGRRSTPWRPGRSPRPAPDRR